jgi:pimeloyl-ACP methyl ester carboxylesterase
MADDAMAAVRYLAARPEVDASQVGILGHSEGGIIAFMNAANYPDEVAYIVSMAGVGVSGLELAKKQSRMISYTMGVEPDEEAQSFNDQLLDIIATDTDSLTMRKQLQELIVNNPAQQKAIENFKAIDPTITTEEINEMTLARLMSPDTRGLVKYDPTKYLTNIKCPTLAINGTLDCQVACKENLEGIAHLVPHATVKAYEGLNHLFQTCDGWVGSSNYALIHETMNPQVINDIVTWLQSTVKQ